MKIYRCNKCGCIVEQEADNELKKEYPFYCFECSENMYAFEVTEYEEEQEEEYSL